MSMAGGAEQLPMSRPAGACSHGRARQSRPQYVRQSLVAWCSISAGQGRRHSHSRWRRRAAGRSQTPWVRQRWVGTWQVSPFVRRRVGSAPPRTSRPRPRFSLSPPRHLKPIDRVKTDTTLLDPPAWRTPSVVSPPRPVALPLSLSMTALPLRRGVLDLRSHFATARRVSRNLHDTSATYDALVDRRHSPNKARPHPAPEHDTSRFAACLADRRRRSTGTPTQARRRGSSIATLTLTDFIE